MLPSRVYPLHCRIVRTLNTCAYALKTFNDHLAVKFGYPPKSITYNSGDRLSSLDLKTGDQIIVSQVADTEICTPSQLARSNLPVPGQAQAPSQSWESSVNDYDYLSSRTAFSSQASGSKGAGPSYVATDAGVLVHRVCKIIFLYVNQIPS